MLRRKKFVIGMGLAALLILLAGFFTTAVFAEDPTPTPVPEKKATLLDNFLTKLAANLGISKEKLTDALAQTRNQMIDEAVNAGKLTKEQGEQLKSRPLGGWFGIHRFKGWPWNRGRAIQLPGRDVAVEALANLLQKTPDDVRAMIRSGKTIDQILKENNLSTQQLHDAMVDVVKKRLDQAVAEGKLTQEQADKILQRFKDAPLGGKGWGKGPARQGASFGSLGRMAPASL